MTTAATVLLVAAAVVAIVDWWAVATDRRAVEYVAKPGALVLLLGVALTLDPTSGGARGWFVVALLFGLAGDVLLMLPQDRFVAGLASFLVGHLAYVVGLVVAGQEAWAMLIGVAVVLVAVVAVGRSIVQGARASDRALTVPVTLYVVVISAMVVTAFGRAEPLAIAGGALFYASDAILGWNRFVRPFRHARVATMVTYHVGQALLVVSLTR